MIFWECAGPRCVHLRDLGAADLNMFLLPPVGRACSEADMQLRIKPAYRSSTASKLALGLVASGWLLGCARAHSQAAPTSQLQQRPCGTQDGAVTTSVTHSSNLALNITYECRPLRADPAAVQGRAERRQMGACAGGGPGPLPAVQQAVPRCDLGAG
jgi:hypothetical protein